MGFPTDTDQLKATDATTWASQTSLHGLKDPRGIKELMFLCKLLQELGQDRTAQVADLISMRCRELRMAKGQADSSWEKAAVLSLTPGSVASTAALPDGAFTV